MMPRAFWTDERTLDVLHRMDHLGQSAAVVGNAYGVSRNAILGLRHRTMTASWREWPSEKADGTMPAGWWRR